MAVFSEEHGYRIEPQNILILLCGWALFSVNYSKRRKKRILQRAFYVVKLCEDPPGMS